jgi:hypothetical protein
MDLLQRSLLVLAAITVCGCAAPGSARDEALTRASTDLNCPNDQIWVTSYGDNKYSARGCGRYVSYENLGPRTLASLSGRR